MGDYVFRRPWDASLSRPRRFQQAPGPVASHPLVYRREAQYLAAKPAALSRPVTRRAVSPLAVVAAPIRTFHREAQYAPARLTPAIFRSPRRAGTPQPQPAKSFHREAQYGPARAPSTTFRQPPRHFAPLAVVVVPVSPYRRQAQHLVARLAPNPWRALPRAPTSRPQPAKTFHREAQYHVARFAILYYPSQRYSTRRVFTPRPVAPPTFRRDYRRFALQGWTPQPRRARAPLAPLAPVTRSFRRDYRTAQSVWTPPYRRRFSRGEPPQPFVPTSSVFNLLSWIDREDVEALGTITAPAQASYGPVNASFTLLGWMDASDTAGLATISKADVPELAPIDSTLPLLGDIDAEPQEGLGTMSNAAIVGLVSFP